MTCILEVPGSNRNRELLRTTRGFPIAFFRPSTQILGKCLETGHGQRPLHSASFVIVLPHLNDATYPHNMKQRRDITIHEFPFMLNFPQIVNFAFCALQATVLLRVCREVHYHQSSTSWA
jgi:hypothetical protein